MSLTGPGSHSLDHKSTLCRWSHSEGYRSSEILDSDPTEEVVDVFLQLGGSRRDRLRGIQYRIRVAPGLAHCAGNLVEYGDNHLGSLSGVRDISENFAG